MAERLYPVPGPRTFGEWCFALGLRAQQNPQDTNIVLSYDDFCSLPETDLRKVEDGELYGFWRKHGDVWGESRTVSEWLKDFDMELISPTEEDRNELNRFLGHDEFYEWSSGKVDLGRRQ